MKQLKPWLLGVVVGVMLGLWIGVNIGKDKPLWSNPFAAVSVTERIQRKSGQILEKSGQTLKKQGQILQKKIN